jgi:hypothetical protein
MPYLFRHFEPGRGGDNGWGGERGTCHVEILEPDLESQ